MVAIAFMIMTFVSILILLFCCLCRRRYLRRWGIDPANREELARYVASGGRRRDVEAGSTDLAADVPPYRDEDYLPKYEAAPPREPVGLVAPGPEAVEMTEMGGATETTAETAEAPGEETRVEEPTAFMVASATAETPGDAALEPRRTPAAPVAGTAPPAA
ncbi:hypothetical protein HDU96_008064 [Phlyctochytrium bullatum]|nr:hypothetical protein HDU96_008064 [Phlyctochytrium bullatum]